MKHFTMPKTAGETVWLHVAESASVFFGYAGYPHLVDVRRINFYKK